MSWTRRAYDSSWRGGLADGVPRGPDQLFRLRVARPAARAIAEELPEMVAAAVVEFITGDLLREPRRVGKPLAT